MPSVPTTVFEAHLVGRDHVGITLNHRHPARLADGIPRQVCPIKNRPLVKERRLGAIEILSDVLPLCGHRSLDFGQNSSAESERPPLFIMDREDEPSPKPLSPDAGRVSGLAHQARLFQ